MAIPAITVCLINPSLPMVELTLVLEFLKNPFVKPVAKSTRMKVIKVINQAFSPNLDAATHILLENVVLMNISIVN